MIKLQIGFMRIQRNDDFAMLISEIANSLLDVDTTEQPLRQLIDKMLLHSKEMYFLKGYKTANPLTEVIGDLTQERTNYLISLRLQVEGKMLSNIAKEREAASFLNRWLQKNKQYLYVPSIIPQSVQINVLRAVKNKRSQISKALIDLQLNNLFESIVEVTRKVEQVQHERVNMKVKDSKKAKDIRQAAYSDLKLLLNIIEVMANVEEENNHNGIYYQLALSLKKHIKDAHTKLKSRNTKRQNKKNMAKAVAKLVKTTPDKEKTVKPNKTLVQVLSDAYLYKASKATICSLADAESKVKKQLLIKDNKSKKPIGENWEWKLPKIEVS